MGTRCGDIDPAIILYLMSKDELTIHDVSTLLNRFSGLYGISGDSNDMRELIDGCGKGRQQAETAIDVVLLSPAEIHWRLHGGAGPR